MTDIFLTGSKDDKEIEQLIKTRLSESYSITYVCGEDITENGNGYNIAVFDFEKPHIGVNSGVLLMKENGEIPSYLPENIIAIINSDNPTQLRAIQDKKIHAVTCGTSNTATVSFSSETDEDIMISLNRSITAMSGKIIQPLEIPIRKRGAERYSLMSYTALRLILDDYNSELGRLI